MTCRSDDRHLIAVRVDDVTCKIWCAACRRWHHHSSDGAVGAWAHRVSHCAGAPPGSGYYIRLADDGAAAPADAAP